MWKIKIFEAQTLHALEAAVNKWLAGNPEIEIKQIAHSESGGGNVEWSISLILLYKQSD